MEDLALEILKHVGRHKTGELKEVCARLLVKHILEESDLSMERRVLSGLIGAAQDGDDGSFDRLHTFGMVVRALNILGARPPRPFQFLKKWSKPSALAEFVKSLDWSKPWQTSTNVLHAGTPHVRVWQKKGIDPVVFFDRLEEFQSANGGWGEGSEMHQMAGAFHHIPVYRAAKREMPRLIVLADMMMDLEFARMEFGAMDAACVLEYALKHRAVKLDECADFLDHVEELLRTGLEKMAEPAAIGLIPFAQSLGAVCRMKRIHQYKDAWDPNLWRVQL